MCILSLSLVAIDNDMHGVNRDIDSLHVVWPSLVLGCTTVLREFKANFRPASDTWPHTFPMVEVHIAPKHARRVVEILTRHNACALVHPHSGDGYADHVAYAVWVGPQLQLDLRVFLKKKTH